MNASYGSEPNASFTWHETGGGVTLSNLTGFAGLPVAISSFYEFGHLYGLNITFKQSGIKFGIPIHLTSGAMEDVTGSFPHDFPWAPPGDDYLSISMNYIFPADTAQGSWNVYLAGAGSPYSVGGLLFEQTAGP